MSEITKLYENAGIEPERQDCCKIADKYWASNTESGFEYLMQKECPYNQECTDECEYAYDKVVYPPFTAEKQIELIKWLILNYSTEIIKGRYTNYFMSTGRSYKASGNDDLIICMANLINTLWQDLTEEEKASIKNILEM